MINQYPMCSYLCPMSVQQPMCLQGCIIPGKKPRLAVLAVINAKVHIFGLKASKPRTKIIYLIHHMSNLLLSKEEAT